MKWYWIEKRIHDDANKNRSRDGERIYKIHPPIKPKRHRLLYFVWYITTMINNREGQVKQTTRLNAIIKMPSKLKIHSELLMPYMFATSNIFHQFSNFQIGANF